MASASGFWRESDTSLAASKVGNPTHLLALRFALFNIVVGGVAAAVLLQGWLDAAFLGYTGWLCAAIASVFAFGFVLCAWHVWRTSAQLAELAAGRVAVASPANAYLAAAARADGDGRLIAFQLLKLELNGRITIVLQTANSLVFLGLVGTVIGFIVALSGIEPAQTQHVESVAPMVSTLVEGISIALYTTLVGSLLHIWLLVDYRMLATGMAGLFTAIVEFGERRAGA